MAYNIALIPGDGIGREVVPEAVKVIQALSKQHGFEMTYTEFPYSCEHYLKTGHMMPADGIEKLRAFDAIFLGAVGYPGVPDHVSLWGLLIPIRRQFRQYVNLRPVRLFDGMRCPLADKKPGDIDFYVVRENCEGEYSNIGGRLYAGTDDEMAMQQSIFTRKGTDRILRYAFELAKSRPRRACRVSSTNLTAKTQASFQAATINRDNVVSFSNPSSIICQSGLVSPIVSIKHDIVFGYLLPSL